jgi:hypothetical protein
MPIALLVPLAFAATSGASLGPDGVERAVAVDLPVAEVMVFSDRARVTRRGAVKFTGGPQIVRAPDLPGAVLVDTVRVTASGTQVVRVETRPIERERWGIDQVDAWIEQLEKLQDQMSMVNARIEAADVELSLLSGMTVAPPLEEKERLGKPVVPAADAWREAQERLARRRTAAREIERKGRVELRTLTEQYVRVQREVQQRDLGAFTDQKVEVVVVVEGGAGSGTLAVEYAVPGAFWKPAYDLFFDPDKATVELKASGLVSQATGEDWTNTKLALSTAIPGQGIDMPKLRTWTLGDDREYVPTPTARATPRTTRPFQPPAAQPRFADIERAADRALLSQRTQYLRSLASSTPPAPRSSVGGLGLRGTGSGGGGGEGYDVDAEPMPSKSVARPRPPMPVMAPAPQPMPPMSAPSSRAEADFSDDEVAGEMMAPESYAEVSRVSSSLSSAPAARRKSLALRGGVRWQRQVFADPLLPAMSAGGLDYVYDAPVVTSVPSQAQGLRVPLAARSYDVNTFYEATPSLATTAYLKATVKNGSKLPILAGPANVFVKRTFSGDAQLVTTGPGGTLELPLGADEDIRLTRTVVPATRSQGVLFGAEDVTDYSVKIEIGNYKKRAVTVRIVDQLPKTNEEKIKVELVSATPKSVAGADEDGLMYWHVDLPPGAVKQVTFTYRITRPKDWKLRQ